ncbi:MAG: metal ABC transporter solute-binding protein, Zn/Mn family [Chloroflexaceae bacterium]
MRFRTLAVLLLMVLLTACTQQRPAAQPTASVAEAPAAGNAAARPLAEPLNVVVTTGQIADAVANIAQDKVALTSLLGPGIDPHTYVPTESDVRSLQNADVIFYNGLMLEAQMTRILEQIGQRGNAQVVALGDQLDPLTLLSWDPEAGLPYDPHIWNDVRLWTRVIYTIRDTLIAMDPANAATYEANTTSYAAQLEALHIYTLEQVARIPQERRVLVTAHDAFNYYGRAYGLQVEAIQGISTASEASAADIQTLVNMIISREVPAIFVESTISPRTIEAVQAAVRARGHEVRVGGELFSDALGAAGTPAGTYLGMMRHNIDTIVAALTQ